MANSYFQFKQFTVHQDRCAMKVTTDACLFGAWAAEEIKNSYEGQGGINVLDIGAGTGLLSLMLAQKNNCEITAIEIDDAAAAQAIQNITESPWQHINIHHADALSFQYSKKYDVIISNPPFYEKEIRSGDERKNTAHHDKGLLFSDLVKIIRSVLTDRGNFYLLLPYKRIKEIETVLKQSGLFIYKKCMVSPTPFHKPSRLMIRGGKSLAETRKQEIFIQNENNQYSEKFVSLLKDYYLKL